MKNLFLSDRIDLHVEVPLLEYKELKNGQQGESSACVRERVSVARQTQLERYKNVNGVYNNAMLPSRLMDIHCSIDESTSSYLEEVMSSLNFSARAHNRILKVARTLADMEGCERIEAQHVMEAVQYRTLDRKLVM